MKMRLFRDAFDPDVATRDLDRIVTAAERLNGLIEATLGRCRQESQRLSLSYRCADLGALVRATVSTNEAEARRKRIAVKIEASGSTWGEIDEGLCLEAIDNLVSNAIKYSPSGTTVRLRVEDAGEDVAISVIDEGQGLSEEDLSRVFRPFQTLSARPTGGETATGLGLSNVREIAETHGGSVRVESDGPGQGATFILVLPRRACSRNQDTDAAEA